MTEQGLFWNYANWNQVQPFMVWIFLRNISRYKHHHRVKATLEILAVILVFPTEKDFASDY